MKKSRVNLQKRHKLSKTMCAQRCTSRSAHGFYLNHFLIESITLKKNPTYSLLTRTGIQELDGLLFIHLLGGGFLLFGGIKTSFPSAFKNK